MIKYIDLESDYGVVAGSFGPPPPEGYTLQQYEDAYDNKVAIITAINDAVSEGATEIVFNKTHVTLAYEHYVSGAAERLIKLENISNLRIDWGNSTIEMMYDSDNKSPFHTVTSHQPYLLNGCVFELTKCHDIEFHNLNLIGEMRYRSFNVLDERSVEYSGGIMIGSIGGNFRGVNINIEGFAGFTIRGSNPSTENNLLTVLAEQYFRFFNKGYFNPTTGVIENTPGCYVTDWKTIDVSKNTANNIFFKNFVQVDGATGDVFSTPNSLEYYIIFADEDYNVISYKMYERSQLIPLPPNAKYVRLQFTNEPDHGEVWDSGTKPYTLIIPNWHGFYLENVTHKYCHRGAMTNIPDNSLVVNNRFIDNGVTNEVFPGKPLFPDTTRYHWNNEERRSNNIVLRDCYFGRGFHGALIRSNNIRIENCEFVDCRGAHIARTNHIIISKCKFYNSRNPVSTLPGIGIAGNSPYGSRIRKIIITENYFVNSNLSIGGENELLNTDVIFSENTLRIGSGFNFICPAVYRENFKVINNVFEIEHREFGAYTTVTFDGVKLIDNTFRSLSPSQRFSALNRVRFRLVNVSGYGNVVYGLRLGSGNISTANSRIEGFDFRHCFIEQAQFSDTGMTDIYRKFINCSFVNTIVEQSSGNTSYNWNSYLGFENCKFIVDADNDSVTNGFVRNRYVYAANENRTFEVEFKDCTIENRTSTDLKLLDLVSPSKTVRVKVENTVGKGIDIINNVTTGGKV